MLNSDLNQAAKNIFVSLRLLRPEMNDLNAKVLVAVDSENPKDAIREIFPEIIDLSDRTAVVIADAFLSVNWELEGNTPEVLYGILSGDFPEVPDELKEDLADHLSNMEGVEKEMAERFGKDPISAILESVGLLDEFVSTVSARDEVLALQAALEQTPGVPLVTQG